MTYTSEQIDVALEAAIIRTATTLSKAIPCNDSDADQALLRVCRAVASLAFDSVLAELEKTPTRAELV